MKEKDSFGPFLSNFNEAMQKTAPGAPSSGPASAGSQGTVATDVLLVLLRTLAAENTRLAVVDLLRQTRLGVLPLSRILDGLIRAQFIQLSAEGPEEVVELTDQGKKMADALAHDSGQG